MIADGELVRTVQEFSGITSLHLFWYVLWAGALWLLFYVVFELRFRHRKVIPGTPSRRQLSREIRHSLRSMVIFGMVATAVIYAAHHGLTRLYVPIALYGWKMDKRLGVQCFVLYCCFLAASLMLEYGILKV